MTAARRLAGAVVVAALLVGCAPAQGLSEGPARTEPSPSEPSPPMVEPREAPPPREPTPEMAEAERRPETGPQREFEQQPADGMPDGEDVVVERIVDGDTLVVSGGKRVRLIGIDTPETVHPSKPVECFGPEAAAHLAELIPEGTQVRLVHDVERHDRYGRTLAYVWRIDGLDVNRAMVENGYAVVYTVPPNVDRQQELLDVQRRAREEDRGLWSGCAGELDLPPEPAVDPETTAGDVCDAAYPDVCIPPPPPDLNCGDIPHRHIRVLPPDPHNLDGDGDGIGCQS